jgi:hypothetical protein
VRITFGGISGPWLVSVQLSRLSSILFQVVSVQTPHEIRGHEDGLRHPHQTYSRKYAHDSNDT